MSVRQYPIRPVPVDDPRFTFGFAVDVAAVLERHGFPKVESGLDLTDLQQALYRFLYGGTGERQQTDASALAAELAAVRAERDEARRMLDGTARLAGRLENRLNRASAERDELKRQVAELARRDITSPLAVILRHGDMSKTVRQEIRKLLADAEAGS